MILNRRKIKKKIDHEQFLLDVNNVAFELSYMLINIIQKFTYTFKILRRKINIKKTFKN